MRHNLLGNEIVKGKHEALIDEVIFNKVNGISNAGYEHKKITDDFPLKPDPEGLLFIQELLGIEDVAGSWMIGDSAQDILAGRAAGMKTCFCNFGFGDRKGEEPTAYIDKFEDLKQILA